MLWCSFGAEAQPTVEGLEVVACIHGYAEDADRVDAAARAGPISEAVITDRMRENKTQEYKQQIIGNLGGFLGAGGTPYEDMQTEIQALLKNITDTLAMDVRNPLIKSYQRVLEKWN